jgi:hypothetical protein
LIQKKTADEPLRANGDDLLLSGAGVPIMPLRSRRGSERHDAVGLRASGGNGGIEVGAKGRE